MTFGAFLSMIPAMLDLSTQYTAARMLTRDGPPKFLVWITRCGSTACIEIEARDSADAIRRAAAQLLEAERLLSAI
jgi:hypothetical protein